MKPAAFDYVRPADLAAALAALGSAGGAGKLIAGGQSLGPMLNLRLARPGLLIDIARIPELQAVEDQGAAWSIGAAVTHARIEDGAAGTGFLPAVARRIAYRSVRNRGTVGGSLVHADPAADWPLALAALDATVELRGPRGDRRVAVAELMLAPFTTVVADDEIAVAVRVPKPGPDTRWGYFKFCRKVGDFPLASAAVVIDPQRGTSRVFLGAVAAGPTALPGLAEQLARQATVSAELLAQAVAAAVPDLDAVDRRLHAACLGRAVAQAFGA